MIAVPGHSASFRTLSDVSLEAKWYDLSVKDHVEMKIELSFIAWQRTMKDRLFHLTENDKGLTLEADHPVILSLRLRSELCEAWAPDDAAAVSALGQFGSALRHTESWLATEIMQDIEVPSEIEGVTFLEMGERTQWADPIDLPEATTVMERLEAFLAHEEWPFVHLEENFVRFPAGIGEGQSWVVVARAEEASCTCTLFSTHPVLVSPQGRTRAAVCIVKINYEQAEGCFDMDPDDGEVRYRSTFSATTSAQMTEGIRENLSVMAQYFDVIKEWSEVRTET